MDGMPRPRPPHLVREVTRHGKPVWYVRKGQGKRIRIRAAYGSEEFWKAYREALESTAPPSGKVAPRSFTWVVNRFRQSAKWNALSLASQKQSNAIYKSLEKTIGSQPIGRITRSTIDNSIDARRERPHSANNFLKAMRRLFQWAISTTPPIAKENPTAGVTLLRGPKTGGHHTWTEEEMERFEARWPIGTRARLAFDLLLYTGLRRGDVVKLGRQHVRDGIITFRTEKTGEVVYVKMAPQLVASIDATPTGDLTYLVTQGGMPFVKEGFGNWFSDVCREAGCPGSAHGLRKAGATRAAENGASERHLDALYGWRDGKMAKHYTEAANRFRLAVEASAFLSAGTKQNSYNPAPATRKSRTSRKALK